MAANDLKEGLAEERSPVNASVDLGSSPTSGRHRTSPEIQRIRFSDSLMPVIEEVRSDYVKLGELIDLMGRRSIALALLILALPMALPIPTPGLSVLFGVPLILISAQMVLGRRTIWLPQSISRKSVRRSDVVAIFSRAMPFLCRLERIVHPRASYLAQDWASIPIGAICLVLSVVIALPIPLGHVVPGTAICLLALGLIEADGVMIAFGVLVATMALVVVVAVSLGIAGVAARSWR